MTRRPIPLLLRGHRSVVTAIHFDRTKLVRAFAVLSPVPKMRSYAAQAFSAGKFVRLFSLASGRNLGNIKGVPWSNCTIQLGQTICLASVCL